MFVCSHDAILSTLRLFTFNKQIRNVINIVKNKSVDLYYKYMKKRKKSIAPDNTMKKCDNLKIGTSINRRYIQKSNVKPTEIENISSRVQKPTE